MREYIRVTPTSEPLNIDDVPASLESLHTLSNPDASSLSRRVNPFADTAPPTFEFLALSEGKDEPVEFYYGTDQAVHLDTVEKRLRTIYPTTFDVSRTELSLEETLVQPVEYTREEYQKRLEDGEIRNPTSTENQLGNHEIDSERTDGGRQIPADSTTSSRIRGDEEEHAREPSGQSFDNHVVDEQHGIEQSHSPEADAETVVARPSLEAVEPVGIQWNGRSERKRDWMTTIKSFANRDPDPTEYDSDQPPLATVIDHLTEFTHPIVFQVVWQRKPEWTADAELRVEDLRDGRDTFGQRYIGPLFEASDIDPDEERPLSGEATSRIDRIESKHPRRTFTVNARAVAVPSTDELSTAVTTELDQLAQSLSGLDGPFYRLEGKRLRSRGLLSRGGERHARRVLQRVLDRELVTGRGKCRPDLVLSADELANFCVVPSSQDLTVEGSRGTRSEQRSRNPLPRPHPDLLSEFRDGMAIGYAIDESGEPETDPVCIPPSLLPTHYVRAATTGGGKSKSLTNDKLSLYEHTDGPIILIDAKGDGLCQDYMRAHARRFGVDDLEENVLHFPVPDVLPGFAFFNLDPALENGVRRIDAVQNKADHYEEILKMVMGEERYERAVVAPTLIKYLIKTLYDEEYGRENGRYRASVDYFAHDQLEHVVDQLWQAGPPEPDDGAAPRSSNPQVQRRIDRQLQLDANSFATVMGGVSNRLDYISQDEHLRRVFNNTEPRFDFRDVLDERSVLLFDLSGLRDDSAKAMTGVILTELYNALKERGDDLQQKPDDYVVNLIIDEASSLAVSDVMNTLLEKGRSFRLSVGLSLQFPEQLDVKGGREVYLNVLNDVGSPIIGKIAVDNEIAKVMAHEEMDPTDFANRIRSLPRGEWIVRLPSPTFGETGPEPFSLAPLPIPPGHPESDDPLTVHEEEAFQDALEAIHTQVVTEFGAEAGSPPDGRTPETVCDEFELPSGDLDVALAHAVRSVQLREGVRDENGWVSVKTVDTTLWTQFESAGESPPPVNELGEIRRRSRLLEVSLVQETDEIVVRLTDDGEAVTEPDTGTVRASGSDAHDDLLFIVESELSQYGFDVTIFTQDGSEKPDGRAVHSDLECLFDLEIESATVDKPVKVLRNFQRARAAEHVPLFVVGENALSDGDLQAAPRLEGILSSPVNESESDVVTLYTSDSHITFNGGANARDGVTAVRPATTGARRSVWTVVDDTYVLSDGDETEFVAVSSIESISRSDVPAVYTYERQSDEYVVYEPTERHRYETREDLEDEWVPIRLPFVPENTSPDEGPASSEYVIMAVDTSDNTISVYRDGDLYPVDTLLDNPVAGSNTELTALPESNQPLPSTHEQRTSTDDTQNGTDSTTDDSDIPEARSRDGMFEAFVEHCLTARDGSDLPKQELYQVYQAWATDHEHDPYAVSWFGRKLSEHVSYEEHRPTIDGTRVRCYNGIALSRTGEAYLREERDDSC